MKKNSLLKKVGTGVSFIVLSAAQKVYADPKSALSTAKGNLEGQIKPIVNTVVVPVLDMVLVALAIILIAKAVIEYRKGREIELAGIVLVIAGIILVSTFPTWGWQLIGE